MMTRRPITWNALLLLLAACQGPRVGAPAPESSGAAIQAGPAAIDTRAAQTRRTLPGLQPRLVARASALADRRKTLEAIQLLSSELAGRIELRPWQDELLVADSVVAALLLEEYLQSTSGWEQAFQWLSASKPWPAETPAELATTLDFVLARTLVRLGRTAEAREIVRATGAIFDWRVMGPFANERGGGFDTAYAPEVAVDLKQTTRGKERDVSWRVDPGREQPLANVILSEMLRPNDQAVAYLATAIRVERPRSVCIQVGSTGVTKLWHDGTQVLARKVTRPLHRDQDRVVLALQPGWNRLLLKVGIGERGAWVASARLTELDGRPLTAFECDSSRAGEGTPAAAAATDTAAPSAREILEARGDDAEALRLSSYYHLIVHPDDSSEHTAKKLAERALALAPDDVDTLYLVARANEPEPGETTAEIRQNERLFPLKRVLALEPAHAGALLDLARFWIDDNPLPVRAEEMSRRALEAAPESWYALELRASVLNAAGRDAEGEQLRERARATPIGRLQSQSIVTEANRSRQRGDLAGELQLLEQSMQSGASDAPIVDALVSAYVRRERVDAALAVTNTWFERAPYDVGRMLAVARLVEHCGRVADARALTERALTVCPDDAQVHFTLARLAQREDDLERADRELAEVLRLDPGYDKARRQRKLLASQAETRFEEPYRWEALERVSSAAPTTEGNDRVRVVDRTTVWKVEPDGTEHEYEHVLLQVLNSGGVKDLDNYWIAYPDDASMQVYNVRVVHPDKSFERAPAPRGGDQSYGSNRVRFFDLPPLAVGDYVDVEYRVDPTQPDVFGQYFGLRHVFQPEFPDPLAPVARAELVVLAPRDVPLYATVQNGAGIESSVGEADGFVARRWIAHDLRRPSLETAMPDRTEFVPLVDISTFENWQAFASWWWNFIEKEFVTTPAMKDKVRELTAGLTGETDKVRAIARFVGQDIRYNAWAFGTHGYQPYSAATIFERRFGDCKDKSILLRQMLAEIGVEAHPVLINAAYRRPDEKLDAAMVGHFNHCIAYVPATDGRAGYYLDATADRNPIEYLRSDDQGAKVLHVRDGAGSIHEIPYAPPDQNELVRRYDVALERDGSGVVKLEDTSNGSYGVGLRYQFGGEKGDLNKRIADSMASEFGKVDVISAETSDLEDIGAPARLSVELRAENLWTRDAGGANLRLGFDDIPLLGVAAERADERHWPLVLDRPLEMSTRVLYRLPEGARVSKLPPDAAVSAPGLVDYEMKARQTGEGIEVERRFTLLERRIPLERYADFQSALREIQQAESRTVVIEDTKEEQ